MRLLDRVEGSLENLFEGVFTRLFRAPVQPAEIAKRLERSLESNQSVGVGKVYGPNSYEVTLSPRDYQAFEKYRESLERELSTYLHDRARDYRLTLISRPQVRIISAPNVKRGAVSVHSWMQDPESIEGNHQVEFTQPIEIPRAKPRVPQSVTVTIVAGPQHGQRYALPPGRATLGRGLENDVVLEDPRVSRHHAEIYLRGNDWYLKDLDSTNGTFVNGYGIRERALESGDRISLGGVEMVFQNRG